MSRLEIFPPVITVYPNDTPEFTARARPSPPMWEGVTASGDIKSDFSLEVDPAGSQTAGFGAHWLMSGIGSVEFTVDDQCRPTSSPNLGLFGFIGDVGGFLYQYLLRIFSGSVEVRDEGNNVLYTEVYSAVSGDVYRLEFAAGFRLYRNGALLHSRTSLATVVRFPYSYSMEINEPTAASPTRIPPPRLIGDWQLAPTVTWTQPSHGSLAIFEKGLSTKYFGGTVPGTYTLIGAIEAAADAGGVQRATATIIIPTLQILGPSEVELLPGGKARFKTNYDAAQDGNLIAWSVVSGGGSFTQGEFTADLTHGVSIVRATADVNDQAADISITVPVVISNVNNYTAVKTSEQIDFDHNIPLTPRLVSIGATVEGTGDVTPGVPAGIQIRDILLLVVETANEAVSTPTDWTIVADSPQGTGTGGGTTSTRISVFWRRVGGPITAPTITDPGDHVVARIFAFRGIVDTGDPWDVTAGDTGASSTSVSIPGDTTTAANCLIFQVVANATDTSTPQTSGYTNADLAGIQELHDFNSTQGNGGGFAVITGQKTAAGAFGATTATLATASVQGRITIALKPAPITWAASIGSINSSSGVWTAPSLAGQTAVITGTNGTTGKKLEMPVLQAFPFTDFSLPVSWDRNLSALISMSEDRTSRATREKGAAYDSYPIKLMSRTLNDCNTVDAFFDAHGFGTLFILEDKVRGIRKVGWFDSPIRHEARDECDIDLSFQFLEARL